MFFEDPKKQDRVNIQLNAIPLPVRSPRHEQEFTAMVNYGFTRHPYVAA